MMYKLLIVEDEKFIRKRLVEHCPWNEWGFECIGEAENRMEALSICANLQPDVVLTDVRMPVMDGLTLISKLRNNGFNLPIVVISGYADFSYAQQAIEYNVMAYILKPIKQQVLKDTFSKVKNTLDKGLIYITSSPAVKDTTLLPVLNYIEENYHNDIRIQRLAELAHLSVSQLMRRFKNETGLSIVSYINKLRVEKAKILLDNTQLKIYEIAQRAGFDDVRYFCRVFRDLTNYSPTDYRERCRNEAEA